MRKMAHEQPLLFIYKIFVSLENIFTTFSEWDESEKAYFPL